MRQVTLIGDISISAGWEHEQAILVFSNQGQSEEKIEIYSQEHQGRAKKLRGDFLLSPSNSNTVPLPEGFDKWEKFGFRFQSKTKPFWAPIADLKKLLDDAKAPEDIEQPQLVNEPPSPEPDAPSASQKADIDETEGLKAEAKAIVRKTRERVSALALAYREGQPIELGELETPTPSQTVLVFLNLLASDIGKWKTAIMHSGEARLKLVDVLTYREADIIAKLKTIRGESPPSPPPLSVEIERITDAELENVRRDCALYEARFEGMLIGYELGREVNIAEYNVFLPQFIADRLFNGVARCIPFEHLSERLDKFLRSVGYEIVPIEVGCTKADSRVHEIQNSRQTGDEPGTIVEVVLPGLQRIADGTIVQKPLVIRGE